MSCDWRGPMDETLDRVRAGEDDPRCVDVRRDPQVGDDQLRREPRRRRPRALAAVAAGRADVFLAIGTSLAVYPAAGLPEIALAQRRPPRHPERRGDAVRPRRRRRRPRPARRRPRPAPTSTRLTGSAPAARLSRYNARAGRPATRWEYPTAAVAFTSGGPLREPGSSDAELPRAAGADQGRDPRDRPGRRRSRASATPPSSTSASSTSSSRG